MDVVWFKAVANAEETINEKCIEKYCQEEMIEKKLMPRLVLYENLQTQSGAPSVF